MTEEARAAHGRLVAVVLSNRNEDPARMRIVTDIDIVTEALSAANRRIAALESDLAAERNSHANTAAAMSDVIDNEQEQWFTLARQLADLTPGGSEFANNPKRCLTWVKDRLESAHRIAVTKEIENKRLREQVGKIADQSYCIFCGSELTAIDKIERDKRVKEAGTE